MSERPASYLPALGHDWLTRFYDPVIRLTLREEEFKRRLIRQAGIERHHAVLDLGCGTGTLALMVKRAYPSARVVGLDGDPAILRLAQDKLRRAGLDVELIEGMAFDPPLPPASFDRILSSLVFHHLQTSEKHRALEGAHRLLRPGGELHIADWGPPENLLMRLGSLGIRVLDGTERTADILEGRLPQFMADAGLVSVGTGESMMTLFGTLTFYRGTKAPVG